jgi:hypothetical protein
MLIRAPQSWPHSGVAAVAMLLLAVLDLGGAYAAKEAVNRRSWPLAAMGVALFVLLFWVYCSSLQYADLAPVTLGWVVLLQVGVLVLDRYRYGAELPTGKWVAVVIVLAAQAYLLVGPSGSPSAPAVTPVVAVAVTTDQDRVDAVPAWLAAPGQVATLTRPAVAQRSQARSRGRHVQAGRR